MKCSNNIYHIECIQDAFEKQYSIMKALAIKISYLYFYTEGYNTIHIYGKRCQKLVNISYEEPNTTWP